jgi:hypothetical protein
LFADNYSFADRLTHRLALGFPSVAELSFELDQKCCPVAPFSGDVSGLPHVFVTGLARAGTTILMRHLHETGRFRSLTYRDMPFPLAPNLWKRASRRWRKHATDVARAHDDGMAVNSDSPEALEEVFWRIHCGDDYIRPDGLLPHRPDERTMLLFARYVAAILASGETGQWRYLSKNNNNVLRLPALKAHFPQAMVLVPFRHPMAQAVSLWRQHRHFSDVQQRAPFVRSYMGWLGHHEFGAGHRPFVLEGHPQADAEPSTLSYWLGHWIAAYKSLARRLDDRCIAICYEDLCRVPGVWQALLDRLKLPVDRPAQFEQSSRRASPLQVDPALMEEAEALYHTLRKHASSW